MLALFLLGCLALNPPLLSLFDSEEFVMGVPLLYAYLFVFWAGLIALMALGMKSLETPPTERPSATDTSKGSS